MMRAMAVGSVNYPSPVTVNGFACHNCSEVSLARKHIDPAHPKSGPDNRDAARDPTRNDTDPVKIAAARRASEAAGARVVGYTLAGARTDSVAPGQIFSMNA